MSFQQIRDQDELARLRASHDALIAQVEGISAMNETLTTEVHFHRSTKAALLEAAKWADGVLDGISDQTGVPPNVYMSKALKAAIANAEEQAPKRSKVEIANDEDATTIAAAP
jgi:hypothetical protein